MYDRDSKISHKGKYVKIRTLDIKSLQDLLKIHLQLESKDSIILSHVISNELKLRGANEEWEMNNYEIF
jgi:hypothetical protein